MTPVDSCVHLTLDIVAEIHTEALRRFGGLDGVRDLTLLESAVAAPQATFGGASVFGDLTEVAAAYLFYLCRNHPFIDGNKRAAFVGMIVFLASNGLRLTATQDDATATMYGVADGKIDIDALAVWVRANSVAT